MEFGAFSSSPRVRAAVIAAVFAGALSLLAPAADASSMHPSSGATRAGTAPAVAAPPVTPNRPAATPPMGWNDWYSFGCNVNEQLVEQTAEAMVTSGMKAAGYQYVNIDDCWLAKQRDANGNLQADPAKFPDGIKAVADYVHSLGLKLGIYEDVGTTTCAGYPGSYGHYQQDADTFASWEVDFVKVDICFLPTGDFPGLTTQQVAQNLYTEQGQALRSAPRPMVYSMSTGIPSLQPWTWAQAAGGNMWRTNADTGDTWPQVLANLDQEAPLAQYAGPGHWNDPDILQVGRGGMTTAEDQAHFSAWAMLAAPLLAGNDLRNMTAATKAILTNREVIALDQDPLGAEATRLSRDGNADVWVKRLSNGDRAVMLLNRGATPLSISTTAQAAGLPSAGAYAVRDLWAHTTMESAGPVTASVPPDSAMLYRVSPLHDEVNQYPPVTDVSVTPQVPAAYPGSQFQVAQPGQTITVRASFRNDGREAVTSASLSLSTPSGWNVSGAPVSAAAAPTGKQLDGSWQVTIPPGTPGGKYTLTANASYLWSDGTQAGSSIGQSGITVPYSSLAAAFNNTGISDDANPAAANFGGGGGSWSAQALASAGITPGATVPSPDGLNYTWPDVAVATPDNVAASGQVVTMHGSGAKLGFLGAAAFGTHTGPVTVTYTDGSASTGNVTFSDWFANTAPPGGVIVATIPYINTPAGKSNQKVGLYSSTILLDPGKTVAWVTLPTDTDLHVFAVGAS